MILIAKKSLSLKVIKQAESRPRSRWYNFIEWFNWIILESEFYDYRYPVKGCYVWRPYGMKIRRLAESYLRKLLEET